MLLLCFNSNIFNTKKYIKLQNFKLFNVENLIVTITNKYVWQQNILFKFKI